MRLDLSVKQSVKAVLVLNALMVLFAIFAPVKCSPLPHSDIVQCPELPSGPEDGIIVNDTQAFRLVDPFARPMLEAEKGNVEINTNEGQTNDDLLESQFFCVNTTFVRDPRTATGNPRDACPLSLGDFEPVSGFVSQQCREVFVLGIATVLLVSAAFIVYMSFFLWVDGKFERRVNRARDDYHAALGDLINESARVQAKIRGNEAKKSAFKAGSALFSAIRRRDAESGADRHAGQPSAAAPAGLGDGATHLPGIVDLPAGVTLMHDHSLVDGPAPEAELAALAETERLVRRRLLHFIAWRITATVLVMLPFAMYANFLSEVSDTHGPREYKLLSPLAVRTGADVFVCGHYGGSFLSSPTVAALSAAPPPWYHSDCMQRFACGFSGAVSFQILIFIAAITHLIVLFRFCRGFVILVRYRLRRRWREEDEGKPRGFVAGLLRKEAKAASTEIRNISHDVRRRSLAVVPGSAGGAGSVHGRDDTPRKWWVVGGDDDNDDNDNSNDNGNGNGNGNHAHVDGTRYDDAVSAHHLHGGARADAINVLRGNLAAHGIDLAAATSFLLPLAQHLRADHHDRARNESDRAPANPIDDDAGAASPRAGSHSASADSADTSAADPNVPGSVAAGPSDVQILIDIPAGDSSNDSALDGPGERARPATSGIPRLVRAENARAVARELATEATVRRAAHLAAGADAAVHRAHDISRGVSAATTVARNSREFARDHGWIQQQGQDSSNQSEPPQLSNSSQPISITTHPAEDTAM